MDGNGDDGNDDGAGVIYYYIEYVRYIVIYIYTCASMYFIYIYYIQSHVQYTLYTKIYDANAGGNSEKFIIQRKTQAHK